MAATAQALKRFQVPLWIALAAYTGIVALSQAFRTVPTLIADEMQGEFALSPRALGLYSGAFHLAFAALQLVMGVALDRHGPRRTIGVAFLLAVGGALISAVAPSYAVLLAGQVLIGAGCAPAFLATLTFISDRYPAAKFALLSGLVLGFSGLGMLITGTPLAWVVHTWSWRTGFAALAAVSAIAWLATVALAPGDERDERARAETLGEAWRRLGPILRARHTLGILFLGALTYASFIALRGLWAAPMLAGRHGFDLVQSGHILLAASLVTLLGPPLFGRLRLSDAARRNWIAACTVGYALLFVGLCLGAPAATDALLLIATGFFAGFIVLQYADVRASYPAEVAGRALALFNMAVFVGVALVQWLTGLAASVAQGRASDPLTAVFSLLAVLLLLGAAAFRFLPQPRLTRSAAPAPRRARVPCRSYPPDARACRGGSA